MSGFAIIDTQFQYVDENIIQIDNEPYVFDPACVSWPTIGQDTKGVIFSAVRDTELHLTIRRFYQLNCSAWDTGQEENFNASS